MCFNDIIENIHYDSQNNKIQILLKYQMNSKDFSYAAFRKTKI